MKQCLARFIRTCKFRVEPTTLNRIEWTVSLLMVEARFCVPIVASSMNTDLNFDGCSRRTSITAVRSLLSFLSPVPPAILCYYYCFLRRDQSNPLRLVTHEFALLPSSHPQTSAIIKNINHPWSSRTIFPLCVPAQCVHPGTTGTRLIVVRREYSISVRQPSSVTMRVRYKSFVLSSLEQRNISARRKMADTE